MVFREVTLLEVKEILRLLMIRSRHRFVYPVFRQTTVTAIKACEAVWELFGGVFEVVIVDTKVIVEIAESVDIQVSARIDSRDVKESPNYAAFASELKARGVGAGSLHSA